MFESVLEYFVPVLDKLNKTSVKRILIYFMLAYPIGITYIYKNEVKMLLFEHVRMVTIVDIAEAQQKCFQLRSKYFAETVSLYVYQPAGKDKTHKERMVFSTGYEYQPLESLRNVNLYSRQRIIDDLRTQHYAIITKYSKHDESPVLITYNMSKWIITPVIDPSSGLVIGEVYWLFKNDSDVKIEDLIAEGQFFNIMMQQN